MKVVCVFLLLGLACIYGESDDNIRTKIYKQQIENVSQLSIVQKYSHLKFEYLTKPAVGRETFVAVPADHEDVFKAFQAEIGTRAKEIHADFNEYLDADKKKLTSTNSLERKSRVTFDAYYRYDEITSHLTTLAEQHQNHVTMNQHGVTGEGRQLVSYRISSSNFQDETKPLVVIEAGLHAHEWISPAASLYAIKSLLEDRSSAPLLNEVDWLILPIVNPDGYEFSHTQYRLWSKTRSLNNPLGIICPGVNIDRNFDIHWAVEDTSTSPCSHNFGGINAFSEPESVFLRDVITPLANRITLYISVQNGGGFVTYPWGYNNETFSDSASLASLSDAIVSAEGLQSYTTGQSSSIFGTASGLSTDYARSIGVVNVVAIDIHSDVENGLSFNEDEIESVCRSVFNGIEAGLRSLVEVSEDTSGAGALQISIFSILSVVIMNLLI